jgi:hypothetical protein
LDRSLIIGRKIVSFGSHEEHQFPILNPHISVGANPNQINSVKMSSPLQKRPTLIKNLKSNSTKARAKIKQQ